MRIAECFHSIQGEGRLTGVPSIFIRTSGCNLRCWFCDTPYTSWEPEGESRTVAEVLDDTARWDCDHVVITGGEPLLVPELVELTTRLRERGQHITIETAGTVLRPVVCDLMSISPKRANSAPATGEWRTRHEARRHRPDTIHAMLAHYDCQFKFVIDSPADIDDVADWLAEFPQVEPPQILLMPQGTEAADCRERLVWIEPEAARRGWRTSPRLHLELFGNRRGT
ncbi:MAG: 7-carboxy-7-deazaguanine synthase QueE [Planctomycetaceae bacterium]